MFPNNLEVFLIKILILFNRNFLTTLILKIPYGVYLEFYPLPFNLTLCLLLCGSSVSLGFRSLTLASLLSTTPASSILICIDVVLDDGKFLITCGNWLHIPI